MTDRMRVLTMISTWQELWHDTDASDGYIIDRFNELVSEIDQAITKEAEDEGR